MAQPTDVDRLIATVRRYARLRLEHLKYLGTEKLIVILAASAFLMVAVMFSVIAMCYFSVALLHVLQACVGWVWACVIMGAVMLALPALLFVLRRPLILNPIARFLTRVLLADTDDGTTPTPNDQP